MRTPLRSTEQFQDSILNSLSASICVIDPEGAILATNEAWNSFARKNGARPDAPVGPGANYKQVCRQSADGGDSDAQTALQGIERVLAGLAPNFQFEYPCHSQTEQRWFLMSVSPLKAATAGAVITHADITDRKLAEMAVRTRESTIRELLDCSTQSVVAVSMDNRIALVNGNTETMFGYTREELLGQALEILIPAELRVRHAGYQKEYFSNPRSRPMGSGLHLKGLRKDGTTFPIEVALSAIETTSGRLGVAFIGDITERIRLEETERAHAQEVRALAGSLLTAQEEERKRVSRDLHDTICQQLAALAIDIGGLVADSPAGVDAQQQLKHLQARVVKVSEQTRTIAYDLHPSVLDDLGLAASLRELGRHFSRRAATTSLKLRIGTPPTGMPMKVASCLYRVAQESLRNVAKHAAATHATVALKWRKKTMVMIVEDDGVGFDPPSVKTVGGLGLIGMEERVRLVNGQFSIVSSPGRGTRIAVEIPVRETAG